MIIHCSKKLAQKFKTVSSAPLEEESRLGSWHGHLHLINSRNCILLCHDKTRFSLFMAGFKKDHFESFDYWFQDLFINTLLRLDYPGELLEKAVSLIDPIRFDTACDRSVQGTLRTLYAQDLEPILWDFPDVMGAPMYSISAKLCHRPVRTKGMKASECLWPDRAMREFLQSLM